MKERRTVMTKVKKTAKVEGNVALGRYLGEPGTTRDGPVSGKERRRVAAKPWP